MSIYNKLIRVWQRFLWRVKTVPGFPPLRPDRRL